jgi:hypothetical protein
VANEGGGDQQSPENALEEMGKLNTARIRKAVDPKIMDVSGDRVWSSKCLGDVG